MSWWHDLKPHPLLTYVPRHTGEELDELERRVRATGRVREPIRLVLRSATGEREIVDGLGRWEVGKRTNIEPAFEDLGDEEAVDVAAVILDFATRRNLPAESKVQVYLDLHERSEAWKQDRELAEARANAGRSDRARSQPRGEGGQFGTLPPGAVPERIRPVHRQRDRIAAATGTSPATVARVLSRRKGREPKQPTGRALCHLLSTVVKTLASAATLAVQLDAAEIAERIERLAAQAHEVSAMAEAAFTGGKGPEHPTQQPGPP